MSGFAAAARQIAAELAAAPSARTGTWPAGALAIEGEAAEPSHHAYEGHDLYSGSAGIGWFLAHQARLTGAARLEVAARAGLRAALAAGEAMVGLRRFSLYGGAAGIALAVAEGARALNDDALRQSAGDLAEYVAVTASIQPEPEADLIDGKAGILIALVAFAYTHRGPARALRPAIRMLGERIVEQARTGWWGARWPGASGPGLCGLGHGASGVGWALQEAGDYLGDDRLRDMARAALRYEANFFDTARNSWPDLGAGTDDRPAGGMDGWRHGAFGIGAVRWQMWDRLREPQLLAQASAAMGAARQHVIATDHATGDQKIDITLGNGLAGAAELMLLAHEITGRAEHLVSARRVGSLILRLRDEAGGRWDFGLPGGQDAHGLFPGRAGIGTLMLRLDTPQAIPSPMLAGMAARRVRLGKIASHPVAQWTGEVRHSAHVRDERVDIVAIDPR